MKVLSVAYNMKDTFTQAGFFRMLENWLEGAETTSSLGMQLEASADKTGLCLEAPYCRLETMCHTAEGVSYTAVKYERTYYSRLWTTEIILEARPAGNKVYVHIICSGDVPSSNRLDPVHCAIIQTLAESGWIKEPVLPFRPSHMDSWEVSGDWLASAMKPGYKDDVPVVIVSQCFDRLGYDVDIDKLSKKFCGLAYFITADNDYTRNFRSKYSLRPPYGGSVAIYHKGRRFAQYQVGRDEYQGKSLDDVVEEAILRAITSGCEKTAPTWEYVSSEKTKAESVKLNDFVNEIFNSNMDKDEKLRIARAKIEELWKDNESLRSRNESLQAALSSAPSSTEAPLLSKGPEPELYEGEQHDMVLSILRSYLPQCGTDESREKELLQSVLGANELVGRGLEIFSEVKRIFSSGEDLSAKDKADLKRIGFEVTGDNKHYKLVFMNSPKYWYTLSKTSSDARSGRNFASDIISQLTVYK
ncbi:MAG: hypothetical protein LUD50_02825 [Clostridia bacterium]|nr:hypothetical protein [Clostridia bacterium]